MGAVAALAGGAIAWALSFTNKSLDSSFSEQSLASELSASLSTDSQVCFPGSACYINATTRWQSNWGVPHFDIVVRPTTKKDVEGAIRLANKYGKPFLAISGGHGATLTLPKLSNGLGIWMEAFKAIEMIDGNTARIGGGITSGELRDKLTVEGKQTVTGACDCTGAVAPMLGGGHGWLQGRYGLMADNLISANLVLANASSVIVSQEQHPDLFWALRGAGVDARHNFGIVTDFEYKIYDVTADNSVWSYEQLYYSLDDLEAVLEVVNGIAGGYNEPGPVELIIFGLISRFAGVADGEFILVVYLIYQGAVIPDEYTTPLHAVATLDVISGTTDLSGVSKMIGFSNDAPPCAKNSPTLQRFPVALKSYPASGIRAAADVLKALPSEFSNSALILEGYSVNAVQAVPVEDTAYPDRLNNLLISPFIMHAAGDAKLDRLGSEYGEQMRRRIVDADGQKLNAYINYAHGSETQQELYGYEEWRLKKLQTLKKEWDPKNRFGWYNAIKV